MHKPKTSKTDKRECSGRSMVQGGHPTNLDDSRGRVYCACSKYGWVGLGIFSLVYHFCFIFPFLHRLKYCLEGLLNLKQTQPINQIY